jgi:hypothetical protein
MTDKPIREMCKGCERNRRTKCAVIKEPGYIYEKRGKCWAKVDTKTALRIEDEIKTKAKLDVKRITSNKT